MNQNRRELIDQLLTFGGELNDPNARTVAELLLNVALQKIWIAHPFRSFVMPDPYLLGTTAGTRNYILPPYFGRMASKDRRVQNLTTGHPIMPIEGGDLYELDPAAGTAVDTGRGDPERYAITGTVGVQTQVSSAGVALEALSDNEHDTDVHVVVEGLDGDGVFTNLVVSLTAADARTPVAVGTWKQLQSFSKGWPQAYAAPTSAETLSNASPYRSSRGNITLRMVGGAATVYQRLLPHESLREHFQITFWRTPQAAQSIAIPTLRLPRRLVNDTDPVPMMWGPALFAELRKLWAVNTGEMAETTAARLVTPEFIDLVAWDNELRSGGRSHTQPFGYA